MCMRKTATELFFNMEIRVQPLFNACVIMNLGYEGHPIKNETFFIIKKSVCVFS